MSRKNRLFIYGYNGFRNIGADCRILAIVENMRKLVPDAELVVNSFHRSRMDFVHGATVDYFHPATYSFAAKSRIRRSDATILCEGNMLTDEFSAHMARAFLIAMRQGEELDVPTIGLALDAGVLGAALEREVVEAMNTMEVITARSRASADVLRRKGVRARIEVTADCAVNMTLPTAAHQRLVRERAGMLDGPVYGIAPVDFFMFPAKIALFGRSEDYVRWPFKGTWPEDGRVRGAKLIDEWVAHCRYLLSTDPRAKVAIFALDPSDTAFSRRLWRAIGQPERTILVIGEEHPPLDVSAMLGGLWSMATSRYHGLVLPLCYEVPYIAVGHDTRTLYISQELGLEHSFVDYRAPSLRAELRDRHERMLSEHDDLQTRIGRGLADMRRRDLDNYRVVGEVLEQIGHHVEPVVAAA